MTRRISSVKSRWLCEESRERPWSAVLCARLRRIAELSLQTFCILAREFSPFAARSCSWAASHPGHGFGRVLRRPHGPVVPAVASMIEAWWRSLKHQWLFLHSLDGITTVRRLVEFYVDEHNRVFPHSAFRGQAPDEMYFGTGDMVPADLTSGAAAARRARAGANRSAACETCPSLDTAA